MAAVTGDPVPWLRSVVVIAAADHGVADEGVSAYPQDVTSQMLAAFLGGGSAIAVLAREAGAEGVVVDAGVTAAPEAAGVIATGLSPARNLAREPALDHAQLALAL